MMWGVEANIVERFTQAGIPRENISLMKDTFYFASPDQSPTCFIELFRDFYGPTMNAYEAARQNGREEALEAELKDLFWSRNTGVETTIIPATFLRVTVKR